MTQDEIIEMARQAGFYADEDGAINDGIETAADFSQELEAFAKLVAAKEREACAKFVDHILKEGGGTWGDAIRARGEQA